ncbi:MAG: hypothetical protein QM564_03100 [Bergeyella sp.]
MEIDKIDFRTPLQREKDERNQKIYAEYQEILNNLPESITKWSVWRALGEKYGMKPQGIRGVLLKMESEKESEDE